MAAKARRNPVVLAAFLMTLTCGAAEASPVSAPTLKLTIQNRCGVPDSVLESAQRTATELYARIGVNVVWSLPAPHIGLAEPNILELRVILVSDGSEGSVLRAVALPKEGLKNVVGVAPTLTRTAYIFCGRVARRTAESPMNRLDVAIGRAIAHEVGHLVLPGQGHSETGIMRGSLDLYAEQTAGFSTEEGAAIRALIASPARSNP